MKYVINIQSFSDIITNSSSELFVINNGSDKIKNIIEDLYKQYVKDNIWCYGGECCGLEIYDILDEYNSTKNPEYSDDSFFYLYEEYPNIDKIMKLFCDKIEYDKYGGYIDYRELTIDDYIELRKLAENNIHLNQSTVYFNIDYGNQVFLNHLQNLRIEYDKVVY